jgi:hypothetical protein
MTADGLRIAYLVHQLWVGSASTRKRGAVVGCGDLVASPLIREVGDERQESDQSGRLTQRTLSGRYRRAPTFTRRMRTTAPSLMPSFNPQTLTSGDGRPQTGEASATQVGAGSGSNTNPSFKLRFVKHLGCRYIPQRRAAVCTGVSHSAKVAASAAQTVTEQPAISSDVT